MGQIVGQIKAMSKVSVSLTLDKRRLKDGNKYPLKLRIYFNRDSKRYPLNYDLTEDEFMNLSTNKKLREIFHDASFYTQRAEKIIEKLKNNFSFIKFEENFYKEDDNGLTENEEEIITVGKTVHELFTNHSTLLDKLGQVSLCDSYKNTIAKIDEFLEKCKFSPVTEKTSKHLFLNQINLNFLKCFDRYMQGQNLSRSTIGIYTRNIRRIWNLEIENKNISVELYPFGRNNYSPPQGVKAKDAIPKNEIQSIFNYTSENKMEMWAKDMWFFSYFANGINLRDIALLKHLNIQGNQIVLYRQKTNDSAIYPIYIYLNEHLQRIIEKWGKPKVKNDGSDYIFDILKVDSTPREEKARTAQTGKQINKYLKRIGIAFKIESLALPKMKKARHSFATVLKHAGASTEMISEQLGHASVKTTEIYLNSFDKKQKEEVSKHLYSFI